MNAEKSKQTDKTFVAGIGASAGGLAALKALFDSLPGDGGMAFVVIIHLSPEHQSSMDKLLQEHTSMNVLQVNKRTEIKGDHVYIIPPGQLLSVEDNHLILTDSDKERHSLATIDLFFRSLAKAKGKNSACVILSGSGSDGTVGMKAVKENGGIAIVQEPGEAAYDAMPRSAINTGFADMVLPVKDIAQKLIDYKENLDQIRIPEDEKQLQEDDTEVLSNIFAQIRSKTGHDFTHYKRSSVLRRIERRMQVNRIGTLPDYLAYLTEHPDETKELFKDLLISVTNFFRDPEAFEGLKSKVIPKLFENKGQDGQVRVWVPGCATGEEAYSMAILLHEHARTLDNPPGMQIFATDIDEVALGIARQGRYPESIAADVSADRLERFFYKDGFEFQVKQEIREKILFADHDLLRDPPFSKLDLVTCRNLLIYLNRELQSEVFNLFHYALRTEGWLFLGQSDSNLEATELFTSVDKEHRIYRQSPVSKSRLHLPQIPLQNTRSQPSSPHSWKMPGQTRQNFEELHQRLLTRQYAPPGVIINENYDVIHATPGIDRYLKYSAGEPSRNILDMVIPGIRQPLRSLLFQAGKNEKNLPQHKQTQVSAADEPESIEMIVQKIREPGFPEGLMHVIFREVREPPTTYTRKDITDSEAVSDEEAEIIEALEKELDHTKEQLQITVEEYETSNEELRASNEELQSMNEELQSTTEELETSKEELQSVNEELKTVNQELESKIEKLRRSNSDLKNLMEATRIGTIFVDREYCVKLFTSSVTDIFNLISSDKGRPIEHVTHKLDYGSILDDIKKVLDNLKKIKKVVSGKNGRWYMMRLRPYRTTEDKIDGVVLTFVDITELKQAEEKLEEQRTRQKEALAQLGLYALDVHDVKAIIDKAVKEICSMLEVDHCLVLELDDEEDTFNLMGSTKWTAGSEQKEKIDADDRWDAGYTLKTGEPLVIKNYQEEQRFSKIPLFRDKDITSGINVLIKGTERVYGVLGIYSSQSRDFTEHDVNFAQIMANLIGESIERQGARKRIEDANKQLREKIERNRQLQREILQISVNERWEVGQYLHDELAQMLLAARLNLEDVLKELEEKEIDLAAEIAEVGDILDRAGASVRDLSHEIVPVDVEDEGVAYAFNKLTEHVKKMYHTNCTLITDKIDRIKNVEAATNLYRIAQEAAKNAAIHGKAKNIKIELRSDARQIYLTIEDDGRGLAESTKNKIRDEEGMGINIMRHRIELMGGTFEIREKSGFWKTGVSICCTVPLEVANQTEI